MSIEYKSLGALTLFCKDIHSTYDFYVNQCEIGSGEWKKNENGDIEKAVIRVKTGQVIELLPRQYPSQNKTKERSFHHLCLEVDDYCEAIRDLQRRGVTVYETIVDFNIICKEPIEQYGPGQCGSYCAFIRDPEGNDIELQYFTDKSMQITC